MRAWFEIVALSVLAAVGYGVAHDQVTVRVCLEYFTVGHPPVFAATSPTLLALGWGIIATWWVGLLLGAPLATMARIGAMPKISAHELKKPLLLLMACCASCALMAGTSGFVLARSGVLQLSPRLASQVPIERRHAFLADLWAHNASYLCGFIGGILLISWVYRERHQRFIGRKSRLSVVK